MFSLFVSINLIDVMFGKVFIIQSDNGRFNHDIYHPQNVSVDIVRSKIPLAFNFCIREQTSVKITNLRFTYVNIQRAKFTLSIDHGHWMTYTDQPRARVMFIDTGYFSNQTYKLDAGWHVIKLKVAKGFSPIVFDYLEVDVADEWMNYDIFTCKIMCIQVATFPIRKEESLQSLAKSNSSKSIPGYISQHSLPTPCAEVDNVNIPVFSDHVTEFAITSTLPQYKSFDNRKLENLTHCPHLYPELWNFINFILEPNGLDINWENNTLSFLTLESKGSHTMTAKVMFILEGENDGSIDAKIGDELYVKFAKFPPVQISIEMRFKTKEGMLSDKATRMFDEDTLENMWVIPDFTWSEGVQNVIMLTVTSPMPIKFNVASVRLVKRPLGPETSKTIYKSDDVAVTTVTVPFSWLAPRTMTVRLPDGTSFYDVTYLQFYRPIPWSRGAYAQVFVLYNDGNVRLLPTTPEGLDWIPFGTSVVIGQTVYTSKRPYAAITQVDIDPEMWEMRVRYDDGSSATFKLNSKDDQTRLLVTNIDFRKDSQAHPFATIRSMYVSEGNTDVDSVKVDNKDTYHVMDKWGSLKGLSFAFHRRCISKHLTLSPDIRLDILKTSPIQ